MYSCKKDTYHWHQIQFTSSKLTQTGPQQTPKRTKNWSSNETLLLNVMKNLGMYLVTKNRSFHLKTPNYILFAQKFIVVWYLNSIRYLNFKPPQYTLMRQFCPVKLKTCKSFRKNCFIFYCPWPCICPVFSPFFRKQRNSLHSLSQRPEYLF